MSVEESSLGQETDEIEETKHKRVITVIILVVAFVIGLVLGWLFPI